MATFTYESIAYRFKNATVNGNLKLFNDSAVFSIGGDGTTAGDDLQLTPSGSVGDITCSTGALDINASTLNVKKADGSETMAVFAGDGDVELSSNNTKRFETVTAGAKVTGTFETTGGGGNMKCFSGNHLDSPSTTSATTYKLQWCSEVAEVLKLNAYSNNTNYLTTSTMTAKEVSA